MDDLILKHSVQFYFEYISFIFMADKEQTFSSINRNILLYLDLILKIEFLSAKSVQE